jgi:hypothetical protein
MGCLRLYLEKIIEDRKKDPFYSKFNPEILRSGIDADNKEFELTIGSIIASFKYVFDKLIEKAPSACMGANDWLDRFFVHADSLLCSGEWCGNPHCKHNNNRSPYNCSEKNRPCTCKIWKEWRKMWRSYPEKEACQKCRYYKPEIPDDPYDKALVAYTEKINLHKCYCRAKELPEKCPKGRKNAAE